MFGARIHTVMPSLQMSFKMGSPTTAIGGVWQDRRPGVLGLLGAVPSTIPVRVDISLPGRMDEVYRYRIVRDPILSPMFLPWIVSNSYQHSGWLQGETTAQVEVEVHFDGGRTRAAAATWWSPTRPRWDSAAAPSCPRRSCSRTRSSGCGSTRSPSESRRSRGTPPPR